VAHNLFILGQAAGGQMDLKGLLFMVGPIALIFYFLIWRPQAKQMKDQREMLGSLQKGDEVLTQGGMLGKIYALTDKVVTLEVASGVRVRVLKTSIQGKAKLTEEAQAPAKAEEKENKQ
jgi:preprotein translocase subunit YajC